MSELRILKTLPGADNFSLFEDFPKQIYNENSPRFMQGNDTVETYLEGCYVIFKSDAVVGRFAFYENPLLEYKNEKVCTIGSFECVNDNIVSQYLLTSAANIARSKGYKRIIGPMEGSTWNSYRFSLHNEYSNFFMETYHHDYYPNQFENFGFKSMANYISVLDQLDSSDDLKENLDEIENGFKKQGALIRNLDLGNLENELYKIAKFNNEAFKDNFLFTPMVEKDFVEKYIKYKQYLNPELIWIVEDENQSIHALSFSIKDFLNTTEESIIVKSLARRKDSKFKGIGLFLATKTRQLAKINGCKSLIHAFILENNASVNISKKFNTDSYKSYSLYCYEL